MADQAAWSALGAREQQEKRQAIEENGMHLKSLLALSLGPIKTLEYTSADPDVSPRPFGGLIKCVCWPKSLKLYLLAHSIALLLPLPYNSNPSWCASTCAMRWSPAWPRPSTTF